MPEQPPPLPSTPRRPRATEDKASNPVAANSPWMPAPYDIEQVGALQALFRGNASAEQQKLALDYIITVLSGTYEEHYRPGEDGRRETDYALGRAFTGRQIVKLLKVNTDNLKRRKS